MSPGCADRAIPAIERFFEKGPAAMTDPKSTPEATDRKTEQLDEAMACLRKYGRQNAVDTRALETAIEDLRTRIATRTREPEPAEA
jgi:hypothetical protein